MFDSYLKLDNFRFLKWAVALCVACIALYALHDPIDAPNGGTWLGYTLGGLTGGICIWLAWLGVRKRQFHAASQVRVWLSAHVYLGLSLLVIGSLHSGFQFAWNVHTLTYVLMVLVVISGVYGIVAYARYPAKITRNRRGMDSEGLLREVLDIDSDLLKLADNIGGQTQEVVSRSVQHTRIGGTWRDQVLGRYDDTAGDALSQVLDDSTDASDYDSQTSKPNDTMMFMASSVLKLDDPKRGEQLRRLTSLLARKQDLVLRLNRDVTHRARMRVWLFFHIPLTVALLAALLVHVIAVFFYW